MRRPLPADLRALEGRKVSLALLDGSRIDDCQLVSAPRGHLEQVWVCVNDTDVFVPVDRIGDVWEVAGRGRRCW